MTSIPAFPGRRARRIDTTTILAGAVLVIVLAASGFAVTKWLDSLLREDAPTSVKMLGRWQIESELPPSCPNRTAFPLLIEFYPNARYSFRFLSAIWRRGNYLVARGNRLSLSRSNGIERYTVRVVEMELGELMTLSQNACSASYFRVS